MCSNILKVTEVLVFSGHTLRLEKISKLSVFILLLIFCMYMLGSYIYQNIVGTDIDFWT